MTEATAPPRAEIPLSYQWNAVSLFASWESWDAALRQVQTELDTVRAFQGRLQEGPATLLAAFAAIEQIMRQVGRLYTYASMAHFVDMTDRTASAAFSQVLGLVGQARAAVSFADPELLELGAGVLAVWQEAEPDLAVYAHYFHNLFRKQAHVRSAEVEELLGMLAEPFAGAETTADHLRNTELKLTPAVAADGSQVTVTLSNLGDLLTGPDRQLRRTAWESQADGLLTVKNTLAAALETSVKQNVFDMRARRHASTLEASLFNINVPPAVFHNLIATFRRHLPTWHRYWAVRRRALGVETLHPYDIWAPLTNQKTQIRYEQAVDIIASALRPLGDDYVDILRRGALEDGWIDVLPNVGKVAGAFSTGSPGTHPFILMSYHDDLFSLSTLAHELGHSMHSYLTWQHQPYVYADYSLFVAEVASNFHQAMMRGYLLAQPNETAFQIAVIEEGMSNFYRYFFIMPMLAQFELAVHQRVERGQGTTADDMINLLADLYAEGFGDQVVLDRERVGMNWAAFGHLFADYYVYQYATGISAAHALAGRILRSEPGAAGAYRQFLQAGSSVYPLDALRLAGVDMTTPQAVEDTFAVLAELVERLDTLTA
ncbi:oligoendopeptidase F [Candidatus Amarolinea aalborgensis]|uniref:oligoendopeptidase F n=1 Tax=Candidatus Amarolinea aalborgensis TaxID=2249329 RepID=UPI003BF9DD4A